MPLLAVRFALRLLVTLVFGCALAPTPARAASFVVTSSKDLPDLVAGDGNCLTEEDDCTLRAAVQEANALAGDDSISLGAGRARVVGGGLVITDNLSITGEAMDRSAVQGDREHRVVAVQPGVRLDLAQLTIMAGGVERGSGIENLGILSLTDVELTKNVTEVELGGALYNAGSITMRRVFILGNLGFSGGALYNAVGASADVTDTTFRRNRHKVDGGGAAIFNLGEVHIENSLFLRNQARIGIGGGAIYNNGLLELTNTTIARNRARVSTAGGILTDVDGVTSLLNVTLVRNQARFVSGGIVNYGVTAAKNSIIAENFNNRVRDVNCGGTVPLSSLGYNLDSGAVCNLSGPGDMSNVSPHLQGEKDNGGYTRSRALAPNSPAIDAGDPDTCPAADQRGVARPVDGDGDSGAICDIGAFEFNPAL